MPATFQTTSQAADAGYAFRQSRPTVARCELIRVEGGVQVRCHTYDGQSFRILASQVA